MGWLLKQHKQTYKWKIWSTVTDSYISGSDWLTDEEMKAELRQEYETEYKLRVIETYWTFPHGWRDKDSHKMLVDWKAREAFHEWKQQALMSENSDEEIDRKFEELTGQRQTGDPTPTL